MKVIAYILFALQALSLYGNFSENGADFLSVLFGSGLPYLLGYFLPAIIGVILLSKHSKKQEKKQPQKKQQVMQKEKLMRSSQNLQETLTTKKKQKVSRKLLKQLVQHVS